MLCLPCFVPRRLAFLWAVLLSALHATAADYYVSSSGNDASNGLSPATAWRSVARVNQGRFRQGDAIKFESGSRFEGNLHLDASSMPEGAKGLTLTSTADAPATLSAALGMGLHLVNIAGITLSNLVVEGAGSAHNTNYGVFCDNTLKPRRRLPNLTIDRVTIKGFGLLGLYVSGLQAGFDHVRIARCVFTDNRRGGMEVAGRLAYNDPFYAHKDVEVRDCQAFANPGDPKFAKNHSGSGLVLYQVDRGLIERCKSWGNGAEGDNRAGGGVGIWVCASRRVVIQHCESFANRTRGMDGGGFDIDGGCEFCVLQYNYSHDNDGPGLMVYTYPYASFRDRGNIVRYNLSENDSRRSRTYAGLWIRADGRTMSGVDVHDNTIIIGDWTDQAAFIHAQGVGARIHHNLFVGRGRAIPIRVNDSHEGVQLFDNKEWQSESVPR